MATFLANFAFPFLEVKKIAPWSELIMDKQEGFPFGSTFVKEVRIISLGLVQFIISFPVLSSQIFMEIKSSSKGQGLCLVSRE